MSEGDKGAADANWWQARPTWQKVAIVVVGLVVIGGLLGGGDDSGEELEAAPTTTVVEAVTTTTTADLTTTTVAVATTEAVTTTTLPTTTTTTQPEEEEEGFGSGVHLVGVDIEPGLYEAPGGSLCYWERLSGLSGEFDDLIANDLPESRTIVQIKETDEAFDSTGCGVWTPFAPFDETLTEFGPGVWAVGDQIESGRYRAEGGSFCYWERLRGFSGEFDDLIANGLPDGQAIVDIAASDAGFASKDCGTWSKVD